MPRPTSRRHFLRSLAAASAALTALAAGRRPLGSPTPWRAAAPGSPAAAPAAPAPGTLPAAAMPPDDEPLFRISLAQWSLHRAHQQGRMTALDFAGAARRDYGLEGVEYVSTFFKTHATDFGYLRQLQQRAADAGVASLLIMIDGEGALADPHEPSRRKAIENHFKWIAAAAFLGCDSIRVNAGGSGERDSQRDLAADSLHRLGELADPYGLNVIVENHGGLSSDGAWLASVMRQADHPRVGTLPDFGNFDLGGGQLYDRYRGVAELMPFAKAVSAKSYDFDARGQETTIDFARMLGIVLAAGYFGWIGIEYEGERLSEPDGIRATKALLESLRAASR